MPLNTDDLPDDIAELKRLLIAAKADLATKTLEAEKLKFELTRLKRNAYGQSSERLDREFGQLELKLDVIKTAAADAAPERSAFAAGSAQPEPEAPVKTPHRKLPEHLPRATEVHEPASCACPRCGTERLRKVSEDATKVLTYIPARFEVIRHVRPAYSCSKCEAMVQAAMPPLPIPRELADASVIGHVLMSKYAGHLPHYRQAEIYQRSGVDLDRGWLADWMGKAAWLVRALTDKIAGHVMAGTVIHADDTPVPVLAPGKGKTGRLWVYLRDDRPHAGSSTPAVLYRYTPDRKGERCREHLKSFRGHLHAGGYAASVSPIAKEALEKIGALFEIERSLMEKPPEQRRAVRHALAKPKLGALAAWLEAQLKRSPARASLRAPCAMPAHGGRP